MWVKLRATEDERQAWYAKAQAKGVTFSEFARNTLNGVAVRRRTQLRRVDPALLRALAQLSNQLEATGERWRLKGRIYEQDWTRTAEFERTAEQTARSGNPADRDRDPDRAREARARLEAVIERRAEWVRGRYRDPALAAEDFGDKAPNAMPIWTEVHCIRLPIRLPARSSG